LSTTAPQTRHAVTAIIVAHDGARLLPGLVQALNAQTHPVEQTVGVDTGSRDRSGAVLAELIGQDAVFGMDRSTGYGEAVAVALRHATRRRSGQTDPGLARVEWIWLLHDDCEPAPDALERLLRAASRDRTVVVVGPKVLDGHDRRTLREVGVSIDRAGRRVTGIDPGEIDQGQHDHKRAVLAVSSAGMLVRRDAWDRLRGFDPHLKLFRDDVDFCWRAQALGLRVQVATDAVLYHHELAGRRRRPTEGGSARRLDRRNALYVLAVNLPLLAMLRIVGGCIVGSLVRAGYFLLTKQLDLAAAYALSVLSLFAHPISLLRGRSRRARGLTEGYNAVRMFIPPARTLFKLAEKIAGLISNGPPQASGGRHQAIEESEEDAQFVDQQSVLRRVIGHPGVQLFAALLIIALIAERSLLGTSPLGGGALVPAWGGASALWQEYLAGFHAVSVGSTASTPPYIAVVAVLATIFGGQAWLAVDVLLLGCVPLAGMTAYLATRWIVTATPARVLLAASYALLPVATGAVAAGRLGTAVAFILLPLIAVSAGRMLTAAPRQARRAAWATGLLVAVASAFAPLTWVLGLLFALGALAVRRWLVAVDPVNAAIVVVTPFFVLFPWSLHLLASPAVFLSEAGLSTPALTTHGLAPTALLGLSPGGPGVPPVWVTIGFALALLALVLPGRRTPVVIAGWAVAIVGLLTAVLVSRASVTPPAGGEPADGWPGVALALAALGLLLASAPVAEWLASIIPNDSGQLSPRTAAAYSGSRRALACAALVGAATAPVFVAAYWLGDGVRGPVSSISAPLLPAFVSASSTSGSQYRTLILRPDGAGLDYQVVRQADPTLGEPELGAAPAAEAALSRQVAALGAPDGADAGNPGSVLGSFGIRWVMLPSPGDTPLVQQLDAAIGLVAINKGPSYDLWQVTGPVGRARVVAADGTTTVLSSGTVNLSGAAAPASGGTLILAEPYGGWTATLNGKALKPVPAPVQGWAQGFVLPPGGGQLAVTRNDLARPVTLVLELIATLAIILLALPGKRADPVEEAEALAALREARDGKRAGSTTGQPGTRSLTRGAAQRLRAAPRLRAGGTGHRAVSGLNRLGLARKRRTDQAADSPADGSPVPESQAPESSAPSGEASAAAASATSARPAEAAERPEVTPAAQPDQAAQPETVTMASLSGWNPADHRTAEDVGTGVSPVAPWDEASDWDQPNRTGASPAWSADPLDVSQPLPVARRRTGAQASVPESPVLGTPLPEPAPAEAPVSASRAPWESGPQPRVTATGSQERPAWGSGPQGPVSSTGSHRRPAWEADPQPPASSTGPRERPAWGTGPQAPVSSTGSHRRPAEEADPQPPASSTGSQERPAWGTGPQGPVSATGSHRRSAWEADPQPPASSTGPQERPPWESGPQASVRATGAPVRYPWESGAGTGPRSLPPRGERPAPPTGPMPVARTGGQPIAWRGAQPAVPDEDQPVSATGTQPVPKAPWESGDWGKAPDWSTVIAAGGDDLTAAPAQPAPPVPPEPEPESGSGPWPVAPPESKPERHSHRGGKHGKPSRWRGSGNRSGGDGES
jgi:GT2 family glycosyltransferase